MLGVTASENRGFAPTRMPKREHDERAIFDAVKDVIATAPKMQATHTFDLCVCYLCANAWLNDKQSECSLEIDAKSLRCWGRFSNHH